MEIVECKGGDILTIIRRLIIQYIFMKIRRGKVEGVGANHPIYYCKS
jgi:hypothetical protein